MWAATAEARGGVQTRLRNSLRRSEPPAAQIEPSSLFYGSTPRDRYLTSRIIERKAMSTSFENATTKSVDVNGTKFVFREMGKPGGVPVRRLHHLTAVLEDWAPSVLDRLAAKHHVIVFDTRAVGASG